MYENQTKMNITFANELPPTNNTNVNWITRQEKLDEFHDAQPNIWCEFHWNESGCPLVALVLSLQFVLLVFAANLLLHQQIHCCRGRHWPIIILLIAFRYYINTMSLLFKCGPFLYTSKLFGDDWMKTICWVQSNASIFDMTPIQFGYRFISILFAFRIDFGWIYSVGLMLKYCDVICQCVCEFVF